VTLETPVWLEAVGGDTAITFSARQLRTIADAVWTTDGVIQASDLLPTARAAGANMSVDVAPGLCVIQGDAIAAQGKYIQRSTSVVNLPINTAPGSGSRTDLIVAQIYDKQSDGGSTYGWNLLVLPGTTSVPPSSIELGRVIVPSGTASITAGNISTSTRQYAQTTAAVVQRPVYSVQATNPPFNVTSAYTDFLSSAWAPLTVSYPPSGMLWVTISADMHNTNSSTSTVSAGFHATSGSATILNGGNKVLVGGGYGGFSRRALVTGTAGSSVTLTPQWRISSGTASDADISNGVLSVEFVS
jgi:hypothetical protein